MDIGVVIKRNRESLHLTQDQLAKKLGVTRQAVSGWERGKAYPDLDKLKEISKMFHISIDELMYGEIELSGQLNKKYRLIVMILGVTVLVMLTVALYNIVNPPYIRTIKEFKGACTESSYSVKEYNDSKLMLIVNHSETVEFAFGSYCVVVQDILAVDPLNEEVEVYSVMYTNGFQLINLSPIASLVDGVITYETNYFIGVRDHYYLQEGTSSSFNLEIPYEG